MRFLRLLVLLPALCLGLLGQGQGWVLCQEACGCVALEAAHTPHAQQACADHGTVAMEVCDHGCAHEHACHETSEGAPAAADCHDFALAVDTHVVAQPFMMPNLTVFAVGMLSWSQDAALQPGAPVAVCRLARGPPGAWRTSPPQVLACVRSVVKVI